MEPLFKCFSSLKKIDSSSHESAEAGSARAEFWGYGRVVFHKSTGGDRPDDGAVGSKHSGCQETSHGGC